MSVVCESNGFFLQKHEINTVLVPTVCDYHINIKNVLRERERGKRVCKSNYKCPTVNFLCIYFFFLQMNCIQPVNNILNPNATGTIMCANISSIYKPTIALGFMKHGNFKPTHQLKLNHYYCQLQ